jgi:hypothetical protein
MVQKRKAQDRMANNPRKELEQYLAAPLEDVDDIIRWWGVSCFLVCHFDTVC